MMATLSARTTRSLGNGGGDTPRAPMPGDLKGPSMKSGKKLTTAGAVSASVALTLTLTGCGDNREVLDVMFSGDGVGADIWRAAGAAFEEANDGVRVNLIHTPAEFETALQTRIAAGTAPDVFVLGEAATGQLLQAGQAMDLRPLLEAQDLSVDDFIDQAKWEQDGAVYGIGAVVHASVLFYNKALFDAAGVEHPPTDPAEAWSWEEFAEANRLLTAHMGPDHWGSSIPAHPGPWEPLVASNGGVWFNEDRTEFLLNQPQAVEVFEAIKALQDEGVSAPADAGIGTDVLLQNNWIAMHTNGTFMLPTVMEAWGDDTGMAIMPSFGRPQALTFIDPLMVSPQAENPELAARFVHFFATHSEFALQGIPAARSAHEGAGREAWLGATERPTGFEETLDASLSISIADSPWRTPNLAEIWGIMAWTDGLGPFFNHQVDDLAAELTRLKPAVDAVLNR